LNITMDLYVLTFVDIIGVFIGNGISGLHSATPRGNRIYDYDFVTPSVASGTMRFSFMAFCSALLARTIRLTTTTMMIQEMIDEADRDGDGEVNEEEFLRIMKKTNLF